MEEKEKKIYQDDELFATPARAAEEATQYGDESDVPVRAKKKTSPAKNIPGNTTRSVPSSKKRRRRRSFDVRSTQAYSRATDILKKLQKYLTFWTVFGLAALGMLLFVIFMNNSSLQVEHEMITVVGLPSDLEGYKILVLSDMRGRNFGENQVTLLKKINSEDYDAIFMLGDMVSDGDPENFYALLDGLDCEDVYFICGDSDPGPYVEPVRAITGTLEEMVLEDWILGAIERGATYVDAPVRITVKDAVFWLSPSTMLNVDGNSTMNLYEQEVAAQSQGVISGLDQDYATLPVTSYRYRLAQRLYEAAGSMTASELHISLAHELPSDSSLYAAETHFSSSGKYLTTPDLYLAGHYCGGVVRIPMLGAFYVNASVAERYGWFPDQSRVAGLTTIGQAQVYTSRGLSTNAKVKFLPMRIFNQPQITVITLTGTLSENMLDY